MTETKKQIWRRNSKDYIVRELVDVILANKRLIMELSKHMWEGNRCPLRWQVDSDHGHREVSQMLVGIGAREWNCPFCDQRFQD